MARLVSPELTEREKHDVNNQGIHILKMKGLKYEGENYDELRNVLKILSLSSDCLAYHIKLYSIILYKFI